ncbi:response regulator [Cohnella faecalis]|uniref:Response regulator n=1 Tax=Cohnella faecalis TaxID=2315694 RepID=A0A398CIK2_9BACL|nr:response regulator [Cohnella faecalis]RIE00678.1 response regulator [Cohnella faecalis]
MLRAIIVDDEELSVKRLNRMLSGSGVVEICRTFQNPLDAYEFVKSHADSVDIAFLDISMPEIDGMSLSARLRALDRSMDIVFVTGYDEYAVKAFDMDALDYLLKPVTAERVAQTLSKLGRMQRVAAAEPALEVQLFNGLRIYRRAGSKELLKLRSPKTEELFAFLVCKGTVSREEVIETLWHGLEPEKAWKNLNSTLYYIRKAISGIKMENGIIADRNEIWIDESLIHSDLRQFEHLLKRIQAAPETSGEWLPQAEALYAGPFLKGKAYEWATDKARKLERDYIGLLELSAMEHRRHDRLQQSLHYFNEALKLDPLREDLHYEVIALYAALGRMNEAVKQYNALEEWLHRELGMKPESRLEEIMKKRR